MMMITRPAACGSGEVADPPMPEPPLVGKTRSGKVHRKTASRIPEPENSVEPNADSVLRTDQRTTPRSGAGASHGGRDYWTLAGVPDGLHLGNQISEIRGVSMDGVCFAHLVAACRAATGLHANWAVPRNGSKKTSTDFVREMF